MNWINLNHVVIRRSRRLFKQEEEIKNCHDIKFLERNSPLFGLFHWRRIIFR